MSRICIGTSGFSFDGWKGTFYAEDVRDKDLLAAYSKTFNSVEINNSFYRLPTATTVEKWAATVPSDFIFSYKASRYITHRTRLKDPGEPLERLLESVKPFGEKVGPILFQLPPYFKAKVERLENFVSALPGDYRYTFEFRERSWLCEEVYALLEKHKIALCFYDYRGLRSPEKPTADFVYMRLHGPLAEAYTGSYSEAALSEYAEKITTWTKQGMDVYCYFDNDQKACAPSDAQALQKMLQKLA